MAVPSSSVKMERSKYVNVVLDTHLNFYVRKNLTNQTIQENKEIKVKKNMKKISA